MNDMLSLDLDSLVFKVSHEHVKDLTGFFKPKAIAVIGASPNPTKIGNQIVKNIVDAQFQGRVIPIHPTATEVLGCQAFSSVNDVQETIDLALIAIPAPKVKDALLECAKKKIKCVAIITSGFAESGHEAIEREFKAIVDEHGMALLGPNMFGVVYAPGRLNASFGPSVQHQGRIAFLSQSGALGIALMGWTEMEGIGLASVVSMGNKADINERDVIEYFNEDPNVDVILIYMEGLKNGRDFMTTPVKKPIVVLKVGQSERGAKAAASHTGSLAGADKIYDAAFRQMGVMRARTFTEAFGWSRSLSLPLPKGDDVLVITNGGGIGVRTTDACALHGMHLLDDQDYLEKKYRPTMPDFGSTKNPIDITGGAGTQGYADATAIALNDDRVHAVIVLYCETTVTSPMRVAEIVNEQYENAGRNKPVLVVMVGGVKSREAIFYLNEHKIPAFTSVDEAVSGLSVLYDWRRIREEDHHLEAVEPPPDSVLALLEKVKKEGRDLLMEHEARAVLEQLGVPTPKWGFARTVDEAVAMANEQDMYPLALKIASPDIVHKTDVAGVDLNILDEKSLRNRFNAMMTHVKKVRPDADIHGINLVQMVKGIECIVGLMRDPQFGPAVMFGLGGVFVELMQDVSFRIVPFHQKEAERLIDDIKGKEVLDGFRGMRAHRESIVATLLAVQRLAAVAKEIDINPLISNDEGSFAVDARIVI